MASRPIARPRSLTLWLLLILISLPGATAEASPSDEPRVLNPGAAGLDAENLRPFRATYTQTAGGSEAGHRRVSLERELGPGGSTWHYTMAIHTSVTVRDEIIFLDAGFQPRLRVVSVPGQLQRVESWSDYETAVVSVVNAAGAVDREDIATEGPRFPAAALDLLTALHGLKEGVATHRLPSYSSDLGPAGNTWVESVLGEVDEIQAAGRTFRALEIRQTLLDEEGATLKQPDGSPFPSFRKWLVAEPPYLVKATYGPLQVELKTLTVFEP